MVEEFEYDSAHCYGVHQSCAIQMWRGEVMPRHVPLMEQRWRRLIQQRGAFANFVVVLPSAAPPSSARREEIKLVYASLASQIKAVGTVIEEKGIKGTAGAMVMTTIMLMSNTPYPYKNGTHVDAIASWLCGYVEGMQPRSLIAAVEQMRTQFSEISVNQFGEPLIARLRTGSR